MQLIHSVFNTFDYLIQVEFNHFRGASNEIQVTALDFLKKRLNESICGNADEIKRLQ